MSDRRVNNPLALAVLACLAERPMHPYEMASTMRERHKDEAIKLNYGSLYSVVESLCRNDFIAAKETVRDGNRPERTVFALTQAGQHELTDWLSELIAVPVKEFTQFEAGLSLLPVLPPDEALTLLRMRCDRLEVELAQTRSLAALAESKSLPRLFTIEVEYRTRIREAELTWTRALAENLAAGQLSGLAEWRSWFSATRSTAC